MMTQSGAHVLNMKRLKHQAMLEKQHEEPFSAQQLAERSGCFCSKEIKERMAISLSDKNRQSQLSPAEALAVEGEQPRREAMAELRKRHGVRPLEDQSD